MPPKKIYDRSIKPKYLHDDDQISGEQGDSEERYYQIKGRRSFVWQHFLYNKAAKEAKCRYCEVKYNVKDGSTSGMLRHITLEQPGLIPEEGMEGRTSRLGKLRGSYKKTKNIENK